MRKIEPIRLGAVAVGVGILLSVGAAASAEEYGTDEVDVTVDVVQLDEPGVLAMTVAGTSATLTENGSDELVRQFTGQLPAVTVTDTRTADEVPAGAAWYVLGSATDFVGDAGQPAIDAANLGWAPAIVGDDSEGQVFAGEPVEGAVDGGAGISDTELLFSTLGSADVTPGSWSASAALTLRTAADVAPGQYGSVITLSLFE